MRPDRLEGMDASAGSVESVGQSTHNREADRGQHNSSLSAPGAVRITKSRSTPFGGNLRRNRELDPSRRYVRYG